MSMAVSPPSHLQGGSVKILYGVQKGSWQVSPIFVSFLVVAMAKGERLVEKGRKQTRWEPEEGAVSKFG